MRGSWATDLLTLVRARNLLLSAAGVWIGGVLALGVVAPSAAVTWAMVSAILLGAAGNAANDLADQDADRVNRPDRPLVAGTLPPGLALGLAGTAGGLGLAAAWWVGRDVFLIGLVALVVMLIYSPVLKQRGLAGNLAVAGVASLPPVYGAVAAGWPRAGYVPFVMGALLHLAREIVKDLEDVPGDVAQGRRTVPIVLGREAAFLLAAGALVLFVPASLAPWFAHWYGRRYGVAVAVLAVGIAVLIARLLSRRLAGARAALKVAMLWGLAALLWDRL